MKKALSFMDEKLGIRYIVSYGIPALEALQMEYAVTEAEWAEMVSSSDEKDGGYAYTYNPIIIAGQPIILIEFLSSVRKDFDKGIAGLIGHEAYHAALRAAELRGIEDEEAIAYDIQWLIEKIASLWE